MAGNGTIALEILEDLSDADAVVIPWGGGGLTCGIAAALRELRPACKIFTAEVATAAPLAASLAAGAPVEIDYQPSWVDGIGAKAVFPQMFERATKVDRRRVRRGSPLHRQRLTACNSAQSRYRRRRRRLSCRLRSYRGTPDSGKIVCIVSGGNIDPSKLARILTGEL